MMTVAVVWRLICGWKPSLIETGTDYILVYLMNGEVQNPTPVPLSKLSGYEKPPLS